jgi:hypothetical protein
VGSGEGGVRDGEGDAAEVAPAGQLVDCSHTHGTEGKHGRDCDDHVRGSSCG